MAIMFPGTAIEASLIAKDSSRTLFDGIFAAGGITLSQVCIMTGLDSYVVQNWVKRKFVSSPVKRSYSKQQFARIIIINMLKDALQIENICELLRIIDGEACDNLISDDELYHKYVDLISAEDSINISDEVYVKKSIENVLSDYEERVPGAKKQLITVLQIMFYAHSASRLRKVSEKMFSALH